MIPNPLPEFNIKSTSDMIHTPVITEHITKSSTNEMDTDDLPKPIIPIKISLPSLEPILATSSKYILVNELTKRRNQLILFDDHLQKFVTRCPIKQTVLDALWYDKQQFFLLLTATNILSFDPSTKKIEILSDLIPIKNKSYKFFTLLNQSILLIGYNEWSGQYIDRWHENNDNNQWKLMERQSLKLTSNEFIGNMSTSIENNCSNLIFTVYNHLTEQWRMELRNIDTLMCMKAILLLGSNIMHDYRVISINNVESDIKWLAISSVNSNILAIDSKWNKIQLDYKHPVQRMAIFKDNYLIVRTKERVDVHSFL